MSIRRYQLKYGALWGAAAFLVGLSATYLVTPPDLLDVEKWKTAAWLFLNANGVPIAGISVPGLSGISGNVNLIETTDQFRALYVLPPILVTFAAVLTGDSLRYTTRPKYVVQNCAGAMVGYIAAALLTILASDARPAVAVVILLGGLLGGGLFIGSTVANRLTGGLPVFGVTTLGGLAAIGLAIILGGITVITALAPILAITVAGVLAATAILLAVRLF
ncbi:hypothetical protein [Halovenus marina]|uniref:hypothetical protein n=1 Tax=Halovenus marina TaxID=3396621 RepID=UPI003F57A006